MARKHKYGSNVPAARDLLRDQKRVLESDLFDDAQKSRLALDLVNRALPMLDRDMLHPAKSHPNQPIDPKDEAEVVRLHEAGMTQQSIAVRFNTNSGRVNEVLRRHTLKQQKDEDDGQ